jgi:TonB family protein
MAQIWRAVLLGTTAIMYCGSTATAHFFPAFVPASQLTIEILSATHGVDLKGYLGRLDTSVKRNWFVIMPESALIGKKGIVTLTFHIQLDGTLLADDPQFESVSGTEEFNEAAEDAIRNAAPFERLPKGLASHNIKLRITFYYNRSTDSKKRKARQSKDETLTKFISSDQHLPV